MQSGIELQQNVSKGNMYVCFNFKEQESRENIVQKDTNTNRVEEDTVEFNSLSIPTSSIQSQLKTEPSTSLKFISSFAYIYCLISHTPQTFHPNTNTCKSNLIVKLGCPGFICS